MSTELQSKSVTEESTTLSLTISQFGSEEWADDPIAIFATKLNKIAEKSIAKTLTVPKKVNKPWLGLRIIAKKAMDYAKAQRTIIEAKCQS